MDVLTQKNLIDLCRGGSGILRKSADETFSFPNMTANNAPSPYVVSASSEFNSDYAAWKAFDGNSSSYWASTVADAGDSDAWIKFDAGQSVSIDEISITARQYSGSVTFNLEYSNNNLDWTIITSDTLNSGVTQNYSFSRISARYWRYHITSETSSSWIGLTQMTLLQN